MKKCVGCNVDITDTQYSNFDGLCSECARDLRKGQISIFRLFGIFCSFIYLGLAVLIVGILMFSYDADIIALLMIIGGIFSLVFGSYLIYSEIKHPEPILDK